MSAPSGNRDNTTMDFPFTVYEVSEDAQRAALRVLQAQPDFEALATMLGLIEAPRVVPMCKKHGTPFTKKDDSGRMRCERCKQGRQKPKSTWCIRHNMEKVAQVGNAALLCKSCRSEAAARRYQNRKVQDV